MRSFRRSAAITLLLLALPFGALQAGEYGLTVNDSGPQPCKWPARDTLNTCTSAVVIQDLNDHFLAGHPFQLKVITPSMREGRVSFASARERELICNRLAELLAADNVHDAPVLTAWVVALNYATMFQALEAVRSRPSLSPAARARVDSAYARHPRSPARTRVP